jgi:hypothetical protein
MNILNQQLRLAGNFQNTNSMVYWLKHPVKLTGLKNSTSKYEEEFQVSKTGATHDNSRTFYKSMNQAQVLMI